MRGVPVKGHPVLEELVKLRTLMEKMKPIDQKLQYQVEKLLKAHEGKEQLATQRLRANFEGILVQRLLVFGQMLVICWVFDRFSKD